MIPGSLPGREPATSDLRRLSTSKEVAPFLALGTHDEITQHLLMCRARWGISYFSVRDIAAFAPVIERLRRHDSIPRIITPGDPGKSGRSVSGL